MNWISFLPFAVLASFCVVSTIGIWYFNVRRRAAPMRRLAARVGGRFLPAARPNIAARIPQFEGGHTRWARLPYNVVEIDHRVHGQLVTIWLGTAGQQSIGGALEEATGGGVPSGFIAVDLSRLRTPEMLIFDRSEPMGPRGDDAAEGGFLAALFNAAQIAGLAEQQTGDARFDTAFRVLSVNPHAAEVLTDQSRSLLVKARPVHVSLIKGCLLVEADPRHWSEQEFTERLDWLRAFLPTLRLQARGFAPDEHGA